MGFVIKFFNIVAIFAVIALISVNVHAQNVGSPASPKPFEVLGVYSIAFGKLPIGEVRMKGGQKVAEYNLQADVKLSGVAKLFSSHQSKNKVNGRLLDARVREFSQAAREFETNYTAREGWRTISMHYDADGALTKLVDPKAKEGTARPEIPRAKLKGVSDTLTFVFQARESIYHAHLEGKKSLVLPLFDTKRLSRVHIQIYGEVKRHWRGRKIPVLKVGMLREPVAGYTAKELKRERSNPMPELLCYFTLNDDFQIIKAELPLKVGSISAELM
jgi:hypothetical protein